jgi:bifunctional DNA-binding transcriptional regulator/antitoxin component of YhaV-PrlF toxin-antitoxin module
MTLTKKRQTVFPLDWCRREGLERGGPLNVFDLGDDGLLIRPIKAPAKSVIAKLLRQVPVAVGARTIIARDHDLTVLEKPFGIAMQTPRAWLGTLTRSQRRLLMHIYVTHENLPGRRGRVFGITGIPTGQPQHQGPPPGPGR